MGCLLLKKLTGAIYEAAFDVLFILNLALALNRLFVMVKLYILKHVNVAESKCELLMYKCLFVLFAIIFAAIAALFMSPYCGLYMDEQFNCFRYDKNLSFSMHVYHFEVYEYLILTIACFLIYCGIAFLIKINAPKISNYGNNATNQNRKSMEMRILVQSFVQYCLFLVPLIVGTLGAPPSWSLIDYFGIITIFEILFFGLNPIIYFISLASFRNKVINGLCFWIKPKTASYALPKSIQVKPSNINGGLSIQL